MKPRLFKSFRPNSRTTKLGWTHQTVAVVDGDRGARHVCDVPDEGAVSLEQLPPQYPLAFTRRLGTVGDAAGITSVGAVVATVA